MQKTAVTPPCWRVSVNSHFMSIRLAARPLRQRQVVERVAVLQELSIRGDQVPVSALVLPAKTPLHPDVGPAFASVGLVRATLKHVMVAIGIVFRRLGLLEGKIPPPPDDFFDPMDEDELKLWYGDDA